VTGGPRLYAVAVSDMIQNGTVIATIGSGVAADGHGNTNTASTSLDNTVDFVLPLIVDVPADIVVGNTPGLAGATVIYQPPLASGGVAPVVVSCDHPSGAFFPLGVTVVSCTARDSNPATLERATFSTATGSFTITVNDVETPTIDDPADITRVTDQSTVVVTFNQPSAVDNSGLTPTVACVPASGSTFSIGAHTVTCTATDAAGNHAASSFVVTVSAPPTSTTGSPTPTTAPVTTVVPSTQPIGLTGVLPATGAPSTGMTQIAGALILLGGALILARRGRGRVRRL